MSWPRQYSGDNDSLQTDVMRFMAIIAFCLIAILALVRNVDPVEPVQKAADEGAAEGESEAEEDTLQTPKTRTATGRRPLDQNNPAQLTPSSDEGLSLRFASNRDFLNLVSSGTIVVFAYRANRVLRLDHQLQFHPAAAPGEIYELLPATIPRAVVSALGRTEEDASAFRWGIRLPTAMREDIRRLIDLDLHGELVIDRHGRVRHAAG